ARMNDEGIMQKYPGVDPVPFNVEVAMAGTLGDVFERGLRQLPRNDVTKLARLVERPGRPATSTLKWMLALLEGVRALPAPYGYVGALIPVLRLLMTTRAQVPQTPQSVTVDAMPMPMAQSNRAIGHGVKAFESVIARFESSFPEAKLPPSPVDPGRP